MREKKRLRRAIATAGLGTVAMALPVISVGGAASAAPAPTGVSQKAATTPADVGFQGNSYGTQVTAAALLRSGPTAPVSIGCTAKAGLARSNTAAAVNLAPLAAGVVDDTVGTTDGASGPSSTSSSTIAGVNIAGGLIQAQGVKATSTTTLGSSGFTVQQATTLAGLVIAGQSITADPAPNTRISLAGLGTVILNRQTTSHASGSASGQVDAVVVDVTVANDLGLALGAKITIGHAHSGLVGPLPAASVVGGHAFGTSAVVAGGLVSSGQTAPVSLGCGGTSGRLVTKTVSTVTTPILTSATVTSTAMGTISPSQVQAVTTDTIEDANVVPALLTSVIHADAVKAVATATGTSAGVTLSDSGSSFVGLSVAGLPLLGDDPAPNTTLDLAGIGTLYLHRVIETAHHIEVRMLELDLSASIAGLPAGTRIVVGDASAGVH